MTNPLLEVRGLGVRFGGIAALDGVDMAVSPGSVHGLIGPNGAGKTTLLNCIGRVIDPHQGSIDFAGNDVLARPVHELAALGIARTFQNLALMEQRTVLDNVMVGLPTQSRAFALSAYIPLPSRARDHARDAARALEALRVLGLDGYAQQAAGSLPYGLRKSVEIARALCAEPRLLMLDEPTAGLNSPEMAALSRVVRRLKDELGLTVLVVTHHIEFLTDVADTVTVLDLGCVIARGEPGLVQTDTRVKSAYLGIEA